MRTIAVVRPVGNRPRPRLASCIFPPSYKKNGYQDKAEKSKPQGRQNPVKVAADNS
jgi:hypothetical protein